MTSAPRHDPRSVRKGDRAEASHDRDREGPAKPLAALKRCIVFENAGAVLSDIGDGILCFEHKTKMNIYDESVFAAIGAALVETPKAFRGLVFGNDHPRVLLRS